jgi:hypothetical protein
VEAFEATSERAWPGVAAPKDVKRVSLADLDALAMPTPHRKLANLLTAAEAPQ